MDGGCAGFSSIQRGPEPRHAIPRRIVAALVVAVGIWCTGPLAVHGGLLVSLDFHDVTSAQISTTQYQTGNRLVYGATFGDWDRSGFNATHALQLSESTWDGAGD
jgi:hypothetical protein